MKSSPSFSRKTGLWLIPLAIVFILTSVFTFQVLAEGEEVFLSDLTPESKQVGWGDLCLDKGLDGKPIKIVDKTYTKGLCAHAPSELVYNIEGEAYQTFSAYIGLHNGDNNSTKDSASVKFTVKADSTVIYESGVVKMTTAAQKIEVEIPSGTSKIALITTDAGDGMNGDHSAWAEAKFISGYRDNSALKSVEASVEKSDLSIGESTKIHLSASNFGGDAIDLSKLTVVYESTDTASASVSKDGTVTLHAYGTTLINVHVSHTSDSGEVTTRSQTVTVRGVNSSDNLWSDSIASPDGSVALKFHIDQYGTLFYSVTEDGVTVLTDSTVGIVSDLCDFTDGLSYIKSAKATIDESYTNLSGKTSEARNHATVLKAVFKKAKFDFTVEFRAYDDGFAYRYTIENSDGSTADITFSKESGYFAIPAKSKLYSINVGSLSASFNHEAGYSEKTIENTKGKYQAFPILYTPDDSHWVLLSEADLYFDSYVGSMVYGIGDGKLRLAYAPKTASDTTVTSKTSFTSPWRCGITGSLGDVIESNLIENVSTRTTDDYSWVNPGVTAWMWLSEGFSGQRDYDTIKSYIDLAAEMGWEYLILDEGWQPNATDNSGKRYSGYFSWFNEMLQYAEDKGVGIIVWVLCNDLNTPEKRTVLKEWADLGIKGIKADFFDSEDLDHINYYRDIYNECAKNHLIVNCHGANKPTGERQYWPNIINREAVNGEEYGGYGAYDLNMWAFTRNVVGPMDLTPRLNPTESSQTTVGAQIAMNILFECGIPCMASSVNEYLTSPAQFFYKDLPSAWDETKFVDGYPGKYTVMARRSGDNWYLAGTSAAGREISVTYDFLEEGSQYMAYIYRDGSGKYDLITEQKLVTSKDNISLKLVLGSGFAVKLVKMTDQNTIKGLAALNTKHTLKTAQQLTLDVTGENLVGNHYLVWTSSNPEVATVSADGTVTAVKPGNTTVTVSFVGNPETKVSFDILVEAGEIRRATTWKIKNPTILNGSVMSADDPYLLSMQTNAGDIGGSFTNVWYTDAPEGDFEVTVMVGGRLLLSNQSAGIVVFGENDPSKAVAISRRYYKDGNCFDFYSYNSSFNHKTTEDRSYYSPVLLKLIKKGNNFTAAWSYDGADWKLMQSIDMQSLAGSDSLRIGLFACSAGSGKISQVQFSSFTLNGEKIPFAVEGNASPVEEIGALKEVTISVGSESSDLALPSSVKVNFANGTSADIPVSWNTEGLDLSAVGTQTISGKLVSGDETILDNPNHLTAGITVKVVDADEQTPVDDSQTSTTPADDDGGMSTVLLISLIIGGVLLLGAVAFIIIFLVLRKKKKIAK